MRGIKQLETDADFDKAWGQLRDAARHEFANTLQGAFHAYAQANNGGLPSDFSQLQTYFDKPVDDSILQGYDFSKPGTVESKSESLIDKTGNYLAWKMQVSMDGVSMSTDGEDALHQAIQSYLAANNGQNLTTPPNCSLTSRRPTKRKSCKKSSRATRGNEH